ncbi:MAG: hypothetical protein UZ19_OD1000958 [Parcubacteria bacterium OLB19]|nr:MAG: hypothetical protein UZ19_OD1000958 [Parcubacteria bacterium OLB19]
MDMAIQEISTDVSNALPWTKLSNSLVATRQTDLERIATILELQVSLNEESGYVELRNSSSLIAKICISKPKDDIPNTILVTDYGLTGSQINQLRTLQAGRDLDFCVRQP